MHTKLLLLLSLTLVLALMPTAATRAQTDGQAIGEWRTHLPYTGAFDVTACQDFTAWAVPGSVVLQYSDNAEVRRLDKVSALSQANPAIIACNPFSTGQLLVAYEDGALDVLEKERVIHFTDAIEQRDIFGERDLTNISFASERLAFISAEFGFLLFDPVEGVFLEDIRMSNTVNDVAAFDGDLYVATSRGLRMLPDFERQPSLRDTNNYLFVNELIDEVNDDLEATTLAVFRDELFVGFRQNLLALQPGGNNYRIVSNDTCTTPIDLFGGTTHLVATLRNDCGADRIVVSADGSLFDTLSVECSGRYAGAVANSLGEFPLAGISTSDPLCKAVADLSTCTCLELNGPRSVDVFDIAAEDGVVAVAAGAYDDQLFYTFNRQGVYVFKDGSWSNFNQKNTGGFNSTSEDGTIPTDYSSVVVLDDTTFLTGAYFEGLVEFTSSRNGTLFDERNSSLETHLSDRARVRISGMDKDAQGNVWIANHGAASALTVRKTDGTFRSFQLGCGRARLLGVEVDKRTGIIWMPDYENGLIAYDPAGTIDDPSDDRCRLFGANDNLPNANVRAVLADRDGAIWVGTTNGIAKIQCGADPFSSCTAIRPTSVVDGINGFFFDGELIRAIEDDGGNRKWIGTDNGLFLLDARTDEQLAYYTVNNSPLLNNKIRALAFDGSTGLLWIGTGAGLMSLKTESTSGREFAHSTVEVYPQPVRPEYEGPIAIRGLAADSNVKITDADGRLVFETDAIGGQAVWSGMDYTGSRPASGIYFVWATASRTFDQKPATVVAKIAFLR